MSTFAHDYQIGDKGISNPDIKRKTQRRPIGSILFSAMRMLFCLGVIFIPAASFASGGEKQMNYSVTKAGPHELTVRAEDCSRELRVPIEGGIVRHIIPWISDETFVVSTLDRSFILDARAGKIVREMEGCVKALDHDSGVYLIARPSSDTTFAVRGTKDDRIVVQWRHPAGHGVAEVLFSGNDRFVAVGFNSNRPLSDENFGKNIRFYKNVDSVAIFDLSSGVLMEEYGLNLGEAPGAFSADTRFYTNGNPEKNGTAFDLVKKKWISCPSE